MKVGDYVRITCTVYDTVVINRIAQIFDNTILTENDGSMYQGEYSKEEIIKSSPNIIDLIEENDYINGLRVEKNKYGDLYTSYTYMGGLVGTQAETYTTFLKDYENDYIQSIVTKEQFKSIEYEVE